jgi:hypothetical protein
MILNLARKLLVCLNQLIQYLGDMDDSINLTANNLQFLDLAGTYFVDCNYKWYGLDTYISNVGKQPGCYDELAVGTKIS